MYYESTMMMKVHMVADAQRGLTPVNKWALHQLTMRTTNYSHVKLYDIALELLGEASFNSDSSGLLGSNRDPNSVKYN